LFKVSDIHHEYFFDATAGTRAVGSVSAVRSEGASDGGAKNSTGGQQADALAGP
jgi:hypothetical protein